jgi:hypothetical protein
LAHTLEFASLYDYTKSPVGIEVPVTLSAGGESIDTAAKVDTGAHCCVFERKLGELLGLQVENGEPLRLHTSTGQQFLTYGHEVELEVLGLPFASIVYFAHDEDFGRNVLGRLGWLNKCRIAVIDHDCRLYLGPYDQEA